MDALPYPALVAVIEDDPGLCADLVDFLLLRGFVARGFLSAEAFYQAWPAVRFDLLLLDVALPGDSGLDVARRVRTQDASGVVMLTALSADTDMVAGLGAGADAYLPKHSSLEVIEATCHSVLRRLASTGGQINPLSLAPPEALPRKAHPPTAWLLLDQQWTLVTPNGHRIRLTHAERVVLAALFADPGNAVDRGYLLNLLEKPDTLSNLRNLDNLASRLRRKVWEACAIQLPLRSSYGSGYSFSGECVVEG